MDAAHGVQQSALAQGNHRSPGGHRLHGGNPEVLKPRVDVGAATAQPGVDIVLGKATQQPNIGSGHGLQPRPLGAITNHHQGQTGAVEGLHDEIDPLVGHQPAEAEVDVITRLIPTEAIDVNRGVHNGGVPAPVAADA